MSFQTINLSSISTRYGGLADTLAAHSVQAAKTVAGWWEIPHYSTWDLGNKFACSQSTLVGRRSHDVGDKGVGVATAMPTLHSIQSTLIEEASERVSFTQLDPSETVPRASVSRDFGMELGGDMGRAHRLNTLLNNPALIEQYHRT
ncbi:hypothetical protein IWQ57_006669, partial [Coemansia nantahalensis]